MSCRMPAVPHRFTSSPHFNSSYFYNLFCSLSLSWLIPWKQKHFFPLALHLYRIYLVLVVNILLGPGLKISVAMEAVVIQATSKFCISTAVQNLHGFECKLKPSWKYSSPGVTCLESAQCSVPYPGQMTQIYSSFLCWWGRKKAGTQGRGRRIPLPTQLENSQNQGKHGLGMVTCFHRSLLW